MQPNKTYHTQTTAIFEAARRVSPDFKLFFEFDNGMPADNKTDYVEMVRMYHNHPNYFRVDGRPFVGAYGADCGSSGASDSVKWWSDNVIAPLAARGINIYFVPTTFSKLASLPTFPWVAKDDAKQEVAGWGDVAQGQSVWSAQFYPPLAFGWVHGWRRTLQDYASALHAAGKTWMSTVSTHYSCGAGQSVPSWYWRPGQPASPTCRNGSYAEHRGGQGLADQWQSVINIQKPEWVIMVTWNDYNESYIEPVDDYRKYKNGTADGAPLGWYKPQSGLDELNRYYIQWYKTGVQPEINADGLFYAYRTSSAKLIASHDNRPTVKCVNGDIADNLYITAALTSPGELCIRSGGVLTKHNVPAGISHTVVPFHAGEQTFSLWRKSAKVISVTGEPVVSAIDYYDYWPTTGYVERCHP